MSDNSEKPTSRSLFWGTTLGLLFPGLGFMYGGNLRLAIYYNLGFVVLTFFIGSFFVTKSPVGVYLNFILLLAWFLLSSFGTLIYILGNRVITKRSFNRVGYYLLFILYLFAIQYAFTAHRGDFLGYELHRTTGNLGATLIQNDFFSVDTTPDVLDVGDIVTYAGSRGRAVATIREKNDDGIFVDNTYDYQTIIPWANIYGKVIYIWFSWNTDDNKIRWERFPKFVP